jgi:hypothetical protein
MQLSAFLPRFLHSHLRRTRGAFYTILSKQCAAVNLISSATPYRRRLHPPRYDRIMLKRLVASYTKLFFSVVKLER